MRSEIPRGPKHFDFKKAAPEIVDIGGSKRPYLFPKPTGAGGGLRPPLAPVGFWEGDDLFDPQNRRFPGPTY